MTPTREDLEIFIYERHKDAYGIKGRHYDFDSMSYDELEKEAERIDDAANEQYKFERREYAKSVHSFRKLIKDVMAMVGCNRKTAIYHILDGEGRLDEYDAGYVCYCMNLPYSMEKYIQPALTGSPNNV